MKHPSGKEINNMKTLQESIIGRRGVYSDIVEPLHPKIISAYRSEQYKCISFEDIDEAYFWNMKGEAFDIASRTFGINAVLISGIWVTSILSCKTSYFQAVLYKTNKNGGWSLIIIKKPKGLGKYKVVLRKNNIPDDTVNSYRVFKEINIEKL